MKNKMTTANRSKVFPIPVRNHDLVNLEKRGSIIIDARIPHRDYFSQYYLKWLETGAKIPFSENQVKIDRRSGKVHLSVYGISN